MNILIKLVIVTLFLTPSHLLADQLNSQSFKWEKVSEKNISTISESIASITKTYGILTTSAVAAGLMIEGAEMGAPLWQKLLSTSIAGSISYGDYLYRNLKEAKANEFNKVTLLVERLSLQDFIGVVLEQNNDQEGLYTEMIRTSSETINVKSENTLLVINILANSEYFMNRIAGFKK